MNTQMNTQPVLIDISEYGNIITTREEVEMISTRIIFNVLQGKNVEITFKGVLGITRFAAKILFRELINKLGNDRVIKYIKYIDIQEYQTVILNHALDEIILGDYEEQINVDIANKNLDYIDKFVWNIFTILISLASVVFVGDLFGFETISYHMLYIIPITTSIFIALGNYFYKKIKK